ncbi:MAG: molybdenum ABC transporter ATP-binding protein [Proteobacteria bacterium]|nr:molybdenum ABC transporter ATP-binding protein [Pseudomonadota bacterium]
MKLEVDIGLRQGAFALEVAFSSDARITALFGRSGSGKTSLLNAIAGIVSPQRGRIAVGDTVFFDAGRVCLPVQRRRAGYVFQDGRLLPHLSVRQNLRYGRFFTPAAERYADFAQVVRLLDLEHLLERRPSLLSGGEKQRVAIGRALLASPRLLLMDEPLASLDTGRKAEILYYVERLRDEMGVPIVYVSHSIDEVVRLADTVVEIAEGKLTGIGPAIGRLEGGAVIDARVASQDLDSGLARLDFAGGSFFAPEVDALVGERVRVRVSARDVSIAIERPRGISMLNILPGVIVSLGESAGASLEVGIDVAGTPLVARITRKSAGELGLAPGRPVFALVKAVAIDRHSVGYA